MENFDSLIHQKDCLYCLNDIAEKLICSKNVKEYMLKIKDKKVINGNYYINKDKMIEILGKSKSVKARQYLESIENNNDLHTEPKKIKEIILDKEIEYVYENDKSKYITTKEQFENKILNRHFVDFGANELIYSNKRILFFELNDDIYFKGKDVCELLQYKNSTETIKIHVNEKDLFTFERFTSDWNGDRQNLPQFRHIKSIEHIQKLKSTIESKTNKIIEPNTIFINESGLYSLILSSKMEKAKEFRRWVTSNVLVSIRRTGSYGKIQNGEIYDEHKLKEFTDKSCVYILKVKDFIYKYGESDCINKRIGQHKLNLDFEQIVKIFEVPNKTVAREIEDSIKKFTKSAKINLLYGNSVEFFEINKVYTIERVLMEIKNIVNDHLDEYNRKLNQKDLVTIDNIERLKIRQYELKLEHLKIQENTEIQKEKNKHQFELELMKEKTRQLELQLELEKLKYNEPSKQPEPKKINIVNKPVNKKNIRPKVKKCTTCPTMISEKSTNCTPCVNKLRSEKSKQKTNRPSLDQLEKDLEELGTMVKVGCKYGVSDNAVRKWFKRYQNPDIL